MNFKIIVVLILLILGIFIFFVNSGDTEQVETESQRIDRLTKER